MLGRAFALQEEFILLGSNGPPQDDFVGICFVASVSSRVDLVGVDEVQDEPVDSQIKLETELSKYSRF